MASWYLRQKSIAMPSFEQNLEGQFPCISALKKEDSPPALSFQHETGRSRWQQLGIVLVSSMLLVDGSPIPAWPRSVDIDWWTMEQKTSWFCSLIAMIVVVFAVAVSARKWGGGFARINAWQRIARLSIYVSRRRYRNKSYSIRDTEKRLYQVVKSYARRFLLSGR